MAVNVIRYASTKHTGWAVVRGTRITPVAGEFATTGDFIRSNSVESLAALQGPEIDLAAVEVLSPVTRNQQFVCQGANYRQHMIESGVDPDAKQFNMIFTKASSCIVGAYSNVIRPQRVKFLDYEIELGLVFKRSINGPVVVTDHNLQEFIAGLVIVNDYSARDLQIPEMQFYKGKSFRSFGPVGPYLCLLQRHDYAQLKQLQLTLTVNGEVRQKDSTANLVFGPAETLTELSGVQNFEAGDLLATGTPAGCALSVPPPLMQRLAALVPERTKWNIFLKKQAARTQYLRAGDVVESRIVSADGAIDLGAQRNVVVDEAA